MTLGAPDGFDLKLFLTLYLYLRASVLPPSRSAHAFIGKVLNFKKSRSEESYIERACFPFRALRLVTTSPHDDFLIILKKYPLAHMVKIKLKYRT